MKQAAVECAMQLIQHASIKAVRVLICCLDEPNVNIRIRAAKLLLEYGVGKPVARSVMESKVDHEFHVPKIYTIDPGWTGINVEHVDMPPSNASDMNESSS